MIAHEQGRTRRAIPGPALAPADDRAGEARRVLERVRETRVARRVGRLEMARFDVVRDVVGVGRPRRPRGGLPLAVGGIARSYIAWNAYGLPLDVNFTGSQMM